MARRSRDEDSEPARRPATSPEFREFELSDQAYDLAERQLQAGTASSQVITHFLKAGSSRERLEQERMRHEIELMEVKKTELEGRARMEEMFTEAIDAFRGYAPHLAAGEQHEPD